MSQSVFETALPDDVAACLCMTSSGKVGGFSASAGSFRPSPLVLQTTLCGSGSGPPAHLNSPSHSLHSGGQPISDSLKQRSSSGSLPANAGRPASASAAAAVATGGAGYSHSPFCTAASDVVRTFSDSLSIMFTEFCSDRGFSHNGNGGSKSVSQSPPFESEPVSPAGTSCPAPAAGMACTTAGMACTGLMSHLGGATNTTTARKSAPTAVMPVEVSTDSDVLGMCNEGGIPLLQQKQQQQHASLRASLPNLNTFVPPSGGGSGGCGGGLAAQACPAHGIKAVCGKRSKMEDMFQVQANFFDLSVSPCGTDLSDSLNKSCPARFGGVLGGGSCGARRPARSDGGKGSPSPPMSAPLSPSCGVGGGDATFYPIMEYESYDSESSCDTLHFFGVYDGHGGTQASEHCAKRLHHHLGQALAETCGTLTQQTVLPYCDKIHKSGLYSETEWNLCSTETNTAVTRAHDMTHGPPGATAARGDDSSSHMAMAMSPENPMVGDLDLGGDVSATDNSFVPEGSSSFRSNTSSGDGSSSENMGGTNVSVVLEEALREAFLRTDAEFAIESSAPMVGSTAVVALVGSRKLWVANCGDSRAVLCRAAKAIQLTDDHKPEREDEAERVERAGGQVLYWNGHRVMGVLAMSRAIGDHALRPYVICEPEITVMTRTDEDDFLLLASDGLWDVMSNQEATSLAVRCMRRAREKGASKKAAVRIAASVLTKAAMDRGSKDNITVVIVDLSGPGSAPAVASAGAAAAAAAEDDESPDDGGSLNASSSSVLTGRS